MCATELLSIFQTATLLVPLPLLPPSYIKPHHERWHSLRLYLVVCLPSIVYDARVKIASESLELKISVMHCRVYALEQDNKHVEKLKVTRIQTSKRNVLKHQTDCL
jgi:hypothetical protein